MLAGNLVLDVSADKLELIQTVDVADISHPVVHDVILGPDGNFLSVIEVRKRRILVYSIRKDGRVARKGELVMPRPAFPPGFGNKLTLPAFYRPWRNVWPPRALRKL